jgi:gas vesicle protein
MRKMMSLFIGLGIGSTIGALIIALFSPVSADEFRAKLKTHYEHAIQAGQKASAERRVELEQELKEMRDS